jgi:uncharacterized protein (TIGR02246 family)
MSIVLKAALLSAFLAVPLAPAFAATVTETELMKAAASLGHQYDSNYAAKNPEGMAALFEKDGVLVSPDGPAVHGHAALVDYYTKRFASGATGHHIDIREVHVQGNGGYSIASFSVSAPKADGQPNDEKGSIVAVYQRDPSGWHLRLVEPSVQAAAGKQRFVKRPWRHRSGRGSRPVSREFAFEVRLHREVRSIVAGGRHLE